MDILFLDVPDFVQFRMEGRLDLTKKSTVVDKICQFTGRYLSKERRSSGFDKEIRGS